MAFFIDDGSENVFEFGCRKIEKEDWQGEFQELFAEVELAFWAVVAGCEEKVFYGLELKGVVVVASSFLEQAGQKGDDWAIFVLVMLGQVKVVCEDNEFFSLHHSFPPVWFAMQESIDRVEELLLFGCLSEVDLAENVSFVF